MNGLNKHSGLVLALMVFSLTALTACSGDDKKAPLPGERLSVLELQSALEPDDPSLNEQGLIMPAAWRNQFWPQAGGYPNHSMQNLSLGPEPLKKLWQADIGKGGTDEIPLTAEPVVVDKTIFTLDSEALLSAFSTETGKTMWLRYVGSEKDDDPVIGGGIAYGGGRLYVTNGYNELLAVNPQNGKIFWRVKIPAPSRAAPTIIDNRIYVTTLDNRLLALNETDGSIIWQHQALTESAGIVGAASPAANRDIVIAAFSSGELTALRVENGSVAWSDNLANLQRLGGLSGLSDIRGLPVIDKGMVIAISFSDKLVAIDERTGTRIWQREIGGAETPWLAGNHLFVVTNENELVALGRDKGAIRWVTKLPSFKDPEDKDDPLFWTGPLLAGGRLIVAGNDGRILEFDPDNGKKVGEWNVGNKSITITPIIANETIYILSDDGTLAAYK